MVDSELGSALQTADGPTGSPIDSLKQSAVSVDEVHPAPQARDTPGEGSLAAEERAGGPPLPPLDPPHVTASREAGADEVTHQVEGRSLPNGHVGGPGLAGGDHGMPGHASELGNGPEAGEQAPPMTSDIDQPVGATSRPDEDVAMMDTDAGLVSSGVDGASASAPLPSHLAPATEPGSAPPALSPSAASHAPAPPSPAGEAARTAGSQSIDSKEDVSMADAELSPSLSKRPIEEDNSERDSKRQRVGAEASPVHGDEALSSVDVKPAAVPDYPERSAAQDPLTGEYQEDSYAAYSQPDSYSPAGEGGSMSANATPYADAEHATPTSSPVASVSTSYPTDDVSAPPQQPAIAHPIGSSAPSSSYDAPYSPEAPMGTIDPGALSQPPSAGYEGQVPPALPSMQTKLPKEHQRFAESVIRTLRKQRESLPFLVPVDPIALNIPQYPNFIKNPMDLGTIEKNLKGHKYKTIDEWIADVRLIWSNCYAFNGQPGPSAPVSISAKVMEDLFEKQIEKIPAVKPPAPTKPKTLPGYRTGPMSHHNQLRAGRASGGRQVRAPQVYEPEFDDPRPKRPPGPVGSQMRYAREILREVLKKSNESFTHPFMHPVDPIALNIPDYPRIVKKPMDLTTIKKNFDTGVYASIEHFAADMRLICKNCFLYNPVGTPVHEMGRKLEHLFESKMLQMPEYDDDEDDFGYEGTGKDAQILDMERQLAMMQRNLAQLKQQKKAPAPPKPKPPPRPRTSPDTQRRPSLPAKADYLSDEYTFEDDVDIVQTPQGPREVTFDMKRELATKITTFEGPQLEQAIDIIRNSVPHLLGDESKEIELDIDQLDANTLYKLYEYVVGVHTGGPKSPVRRKPEATLTAAGHRAQKSGRAGTGGLKGTHLDESIESAKIAALEQKLSALENNGVGSPSAGSPSHIGAATNNAAAEDMSSSEDNYSSDSDQD